MPNICNVAMGIISMFYHFVITFGVLKMSRLCQLYATLLWASFHNVTWRYITPKGDVIG